MIEMRVRSKRSDEFMEKYKGSQVLDGMVNILLTGPSRVFKPDGKILAVYLPGAVRDLSAQTFDDFSSIRVQTDNRGYASGGQRVRRPGDTSRTRAPLVTSSILGTIDMDRTGLKEPVCRLTAFNAKEVEKWPRLVPMFQAIAAKFAEHVPDRYKAQVEYAQRTDAAWLIPDTPFTTITVNNTYPTGIHTDKGDLDEGFSTLACLRRGEYTGGWITFPQFGVAADLQDGDLLLMDAHEWHGNTTLRCGHCEDPLKKFGHVCAGRPGMDHYTSPERVSIVSYFRTGVAACGNAEEEEAKRASIRDAHNLKAMGLEYGEQ